VKIAHQGKRVRHATQESAKHHGGGWVEQNETQGHDEAQKPIDKPARTQSSTMTIQIAGY
jgi:hypothetical protein